MKKEKKYFIISIILAFITACTAIILDPIISDVVLAPKTGSFDYLWKLNDRRTVIMVLVWFWFIIQIVGNVLIFNKRRKDSELKRNSFSKYNQQLLIFNGIMIIIHIIHSILFYDMFAQDFPSYTSQIAVIIMLVILLIMQSPSRGFILGYKLPNNAAINLLYKIHGPLFLLALTYTLWYHPFINTSGHIVGFFYMYLLFIQVGFTGTKIHYNRKWVAFLEAFVLFHGTSVAIFVQESSLWSMFFFGFLFIFIFSQLYSFTSNRKIIISLTLIYILGTIFYYANTNIINLNEVIRIPLIEYLFALAIYGLLIIFYQIKKNK